jgi:hypothetical protein
MKKNKHYTTARSRLSTEMNKSINKPGPSRPIAVINRRTDNTVQRFCMRKSAKWPATKEKLISNLVYKSISPEEEI